MLNHEKKCNIKILKNGPYMVTGNVPLLEKIIVSKGKINEFMDGCKLPQAEEYALCRCGESKIAPFCDGTHEKVGFIGVEKASKETFEDRADLLEGPDLDLLDDNRCAFARFCHREDGKVWELTENSDNPKYKEEAIIAASECPAGRLVAYDKTGKAIEPEYEPAIEILQDFEKGVSGPIFVKGNIPIESSDGYVYEIRNRVTLCRCGKSRNTPFCDATHISKKYLDHLTKGVPMENTVFLNSAKLNFDQKLDFSSIDELTTFKKYAESSDGEILERVKDQTIIITKELPLGRDLISQFPPSVKLICEAGTGYNNIDIVAAREKNITVCNVPSYSTEAVAHLVITYILNFSSSLIQRQIMIKQKNFANFTQHVELPHFEVQNKTLGVIGGGGAIGQEVIKIALVLGMNILVFSRTPKSWDNPNIEAVSLEELLKRSDFVTLHCPLTADTLHLINKDRVALMKPSAYIINTSRGAIIKETDLIEALQNRKIAGAALDVQDPEPPVPTNPLFEMENVILTSHIGWRRFESRQRLITLMAVNIQSFIQGNLINVVN